MKLCEGKWNEIKRKIGIPGCNFVKRRKRETMRQTEGIKMKIIIIVLNSKVYLDMI